MSKMRQCLCCGTKYQYCPVCGADAGKPAWMANYDTEECREVFNAVSGYNMGIKTKEKVKEVLDKYYIVDFSKFTDVVQKTLNEMFPSEEPKRIKKKNNRMDIDFISETTDEPVVAEEGISE